MVKIIMHYLLVIVACFPDDKSVLIRVIDELLCLKIDNDSLCGDNKTWAVEKQKKCMK